MGAIETRGLTKRFEQGTGSTVAVFTELSFEVADLEFLAIVTFFIARDRITNFI